MLQANVPGEVTVLGLGDMGGVLAKVLLDNGCRVTVWNRTSKKAESLVRDGAILAPTVAAAVSSSPIVIICITDYKVTQSILEAPEVLPTLSGRLLVQLSTGTPQEARNSETWSHKQGAEYLDGAILATPVQVGKPHTPIVISGAQSAFQTSEPTLKILAGGLKYVGESVGAASAWDLGFLSYLWGSTLGVLHSARIFESEGIPLDTLGPMVTEVTPIIGEMMKHESDVINTEVYDKPQSSVNVCALSVGLLIKQAQEAGINSSIPTFAHDLFKKAMDAGYGDEEFGALIKVLRK
ncbi:hypothetical protein K7432_010875 [Basidiobolus ranarum]|uniref:3-hydroxyisobutyrate dehydrogenase n=1 Tax=Basidiobolus ranarum TaxID=34480 RepID=A0ABR2WN09_9FUNG